MEVQVDISGVYLETERLYLRPWDYSDLDDFYAYAKDPEVGPRAGWEPHSSKQVSKRILELFIQGKKTFAIELKEQAKAIGSVGIEPMRHEDLGFEGYLGRELGYVLSKEYWNQGIMTEAVAAVIDYCFKDFGLDYLLCGHFIENDASRKVMVKNGFVYLKTVEFEDQRGILHDTLLYSLWNPLRKKAGL